jgi:phage shock protein A
VAQTTTKQKSSKAKQESVPLLDRLTGAGEDALQRIADLPGGTRALTAFTDLRTRVDELTKKVRGIDDLEARIVKLEKQVAELKTQRRAQQKPPASRPTTPPSTPPAS